MAQSAVSKTDWKEVLQKLEDFLDLYLGKKAPSLPVDVKELIVKIAPWFALVFGGLCLLIILPVLGVSLFAFPFTLMFGVGRGFSFGWLLSIVMLVLSVSAISGLFARQKKAWYIMYYLELISIFTNPIGAILGLYLLFQVKEYYK